MSQNYFLVVFATLSVMILLVSCEDELKEYYSHEYYRQCNELEYQDSLFIIQSLEGKWDVEYLHCEESIGYRLHQVKLIIKSDLTYSSNFPEFLDIKGQPVQPYRLRRVNEKNWEISFYSDHLQGMLFLCNDRLLIGGYQIGCNTFLSR